MAGETLPTWDEANAAAKPSLPTWDEALKTGESSDWGSLKSMGAVGALLDPSKENLQQMSDAQRDFLDKNPIGRVMTAFGHGIKDRFGSEELGFSEESKDEMAKLGIINDFQNNQLSFARSVREAVVLPAAMGVDLALRSTMAVVGGATEALGQTAKEVPSSVAYPIKVAAEISGGVESGFGLGGEFVGVHAAEIPKARSLGVIAEGEEGYFGTKDPTPEQVTQRAQAHAELPPVEAREPIAPPTVHDVARQVAPDVFNEYDRLATQRETVGRWIRQYAEENRQALEESSPYAQQIADLEESMAGGSKRQKKIAQEKIDDLKDQHNDWVAEESKKQTPDMKQLLDAYQKADYRMRDMAPDVSKAYRAAEERMPKSEATVAPKEVTDLTPLETQKAAFATEAKSTKSTPKERAVLRRVASDKFDPEIAKKDMAWAAENNRPDIVQTLAEKATQLHDAGAIKERLPGGIAGHVEKELIKAGRPAEEAKHAAQLIQAHYQARSERFKGLKGTPEEMYARDSAVIKAGRQSAKTRARELAQPDALFQPGDYGLPGFYSKMYRTLGEQLNAKGTPEQMLQQIQSMAKNGKFKQDELYWSGIEDYLKEMPKDQKLTKEELMEWLDNNKLEVSEHILDQEGDSGGFTEDDVSFGRTGRVDVESEDPSSFEVEVDHHVETFHEEFPADADGAKKYFEEEDNRSDLVDETEGADGEKEYSWDEDRVRKEAEQRARDSFEEFGDEVADVSVGHGAHDFKIYWNDEAGTWRITHDDGSEISSGSSKHPEEAASDALWEHLYDQEYIRRSDDVQEGSTQYSDYQSQGPKRDYRELLITLPQIRDKGVSQHGWPENAQDDNILLHTRFNTRTDKEGKKTLFIEEIQSDWHQQGREKGYVDEKRRKELENSMEQSFAKVEEIIKKHDNLGFDSENEAVNALRSHDDWANRWDIEGYDDIVAIDSWRSDAKEMRKIRDGVAQAPFADLNKYSELAMKRLIGWAAEHGYEKVSWTTGEQQASRWAGALQRHVQEIRVSPESTPEALKIKVVRSGGSNVSDFIAKQAKNATYDEDTGYLTIKPEEIGTIFGKGLQDDIVARAEKMKNPREIPAFDESKVEVQQVGAKVDIFYDGELVANSPIGSGDLPREEYVKLAKESFDEKTTAGADEVISGLDLKISDKGMKEVYDKVLVNTANSIIKKYGVKVKAAEIDMGGFRREVDKASIPTMEQIRGKYDELLKQKKEAGLAEDESTNEKWSYYENDILQSLEKFFEVANDKGEEKALTAIGEEDNRVSRVIRGLFNIKAEDIPIHSEQWSFDMTPELAKSAVEGQTLFQGARGKIRLATNDTKAAITLFKSADASTFIHETGHHWLDELMKDAVDPQAPKDLIADAKAVRDWLGAGEGDITTRQHEKFARGFERYLMEGVAPNQQLANAFARFKQWLTDIYKTVQKLRSPINDDIRHVFDRLLSAKPEKTVIAPDAEAGKMMADIHELDAKNTPPEHAAAMRDNVEGEIDKTAYLHNPEVYDALKAAESGSEAGNVPPPAQGAPADGGEPANQPAAEQPAAIPASGGAAGGEGAGQRAKETVDRTSPGVPAGPHTVLPRSESNLVDKAGNIRLDNLNTPEDVNQVLRQVADENGGFVDARRGVISDAQAIDLADALGMDAKTLDMRKIGQAYNSEQIIAARKLLIQSATNLRDVMAKAASGSEQDVMAYAEAKARHMMIQEQVSGITAEAGRALRAFRELEGSQETKMLGEFLKDTTGKDLFQLQQEAKLGASLDTPQKLSKFINDSKKATFTDMIMEYWINALLSGPKTHITNMLSNALVALYSIPESLVAAGVGKVLGSSERVAFEEAKGRAFGLLQGAQDGAVAAWHAFKNEAVSDDAMKLEQRKFQAIPGKLGKVVRVPGRLLTAEDELFKGIAARQELNALAYRQGVKEGLSGNALAARMADIVLHPTEDMMKQAQAAAKYQTFTKELGKTGRSIQQFANSHPFIKFVIPFIRTPTNIIKYAGERSPLGLFSAEVRANLSGKNGTIARDTQTARMALGTTIGLATVMAAIKGQVTGGGPTDPREMAMLRQTGWQPYSIKIGGMYYSYNRFEPLGSILGVSADMTEISEAISDADAAKLATMVMAAISKNLTSKTWLQGPSDLIQAISDPDRYGGSYVKKFAGTIVPAAVAQYAQSQDPVMREARTTLDGIKSRLPGLSETLLPRRDVWGEPIVKEGSAGPDLLSPIYESSLKNDPVNQRLLALKIYPSKPERKIRGVDLTPQQYDDYARQAGRMAKMRLNAAVGTKGFENLPETAQIDIIKNILNQSREVARSLVMMQNPDIIRQATNAKLQTLRGSNAQHDSRPH